MVRFTGNAVVRRLRGDTVADKITGNLITYDNTAEVFSVEGGSSASGSSDGRVRAVLSPREGSAAAEAAAAASAAAASAPAGKP